MDSSNLSALLLIFMLVISSSPLSLACGYCPPSTPKTPKGPITVPPIIVNPPITVPPIVVRPPITVPPIVVKPPITVPPIIVRPPITVPPIVVKPPITVPPIIVRPPITVPPITLPPIIVKPPITVPPITVPPVIGGGKPPGTGTAGCPPPPAPAKQCPVDAVKFGTCLYILGSPVHIGDPAVTCCPIVEGLEGLEAALCVCTTIKGMFMGMDFLFPLAIQLLVTGCGKSIPPGYTCPS
ncbi:36.4 kDa proline-rich protein [Musa acuminata AAA Group]|uniref:36.4 kDa proline-rich protein n=1 Tax=Musa acuminata AAA Group TaxID=214697 RepID=UPI0031D98B0C